MIGLTGWIAFWVLERHLVRELMRASRTSTVVDNRWCTAFYSAGALVLILMGGAIGSAGVPTTPFRLPPGMSPTLVPCPPPVGESPVPAAPAEKIHRQP
ncbi:MAG: hypothetical protein H0W08_26410 [Acidobacteria bacterium]|nr:hypothetical protein [Acidobacteriota bacterium]